MVLLSFLLVLAAAVTLIVGLLQSGLTLIYLSIGCSVVAGLVLAVAVLRGRPEPRPATGAAPYSPPPAPSYTPPPEPVTVGAASEPWRPLIEESPTPPPPPARRFGRPAPVTVAEEEEPEPSPILGRARRAASPPAVADITDEVPVVGAREEFPIPDYDALRAPELIRRLDDLDADQLEQVRRREIGSKNRVSVISRIDARLETLQGPGWQIDEAAWEGGAEPAEADLDAGYEEEPAAELPIDNYDSLRVGQILPQLRTLSPDELEAVREHEASGKARSAVLDRIDALAKGQEAAPLEARAAPAAKAASSRKSAVKAAVKKAAAARKAPAAEPPAAAEAPAGGGGSKMASAVAAAKARQAKK